MYGHTGMYKVWRIENQRYIGIMIKQRANKRNKFPEFIISFDWIADLWRFHTHVIRTERKN